MTPNFQSQHSSFEYSHVTLDSFLVFTCDFEITPLLYRGLSLEDAKKEIEVGIEWLLPLLKEKNILATFFVEGLLCKWFPHLVGMLKEEGHEIGCHGYIHASYGGVWFPLRHVIPKNLSVCERRVHIRRAVKVIETSVGERPRSFRAPYLAVDEKTIEILKDEGFLVDSSLYNLAFGMPSLPYHLNPFNVAREGEGELFEAPITVSPVPRRKRLFFYTHVPLMDLDITTIRNTIFLLQRVSSFSDNPTIIIPIIHLWEYFFYKASQIQINHENITKLNHFFELSKRIGMKSVTMRDMIEIFDRPG
jgi:hypothetical protein